MNHLYVSKRPAKKRINKLTVLLITSLLLLALAFFANKIREGLRKPFMNYDIHSREFGIMNFNDNTLADSFAGNLCIVNEDLSSKRINMKEAKAAVLFSLDNQEVLYSKNAHKKVYPASLTKVMTALLALENAKLSDEVVVTEAIKELPYGSSSCNIKVGDKLTVEQLLYGMLLPSGGDAALALASHISGDVKSFCKDMNDRAHELGATNTNFLNPHGFFENSHYTTPYDMYLIFNEAIKHPDFLKIIGTPKYICNYTDSKDRASQMVFTNTNYYINGNHKAPIEAQVIGGKTGYTSEAGRCLILVSRDIDKNSYISMIFKSKDQNVLYRQMDNLLKEIE